MYDDDDFHNIMPALVFTAQAALHLRTAAEPAIPTLVILAQQVLDEAVRFAAGVGGADTFEELAAVYQVHYPPLNERLTQLAGQVIPSVAQTAYAALWAVWEQAVQTEILYHCAIDQLLGGDNSLSGATEGRSAVRYGESVTTILVPKLVPTLLPIGIPKLPTSPEIFCFNNCTG